MEKYRESMKIAQKKYKKEHRKEATKLEYDRYHRKKLFDYNLQSMKLLKISINFFE